MNLTRHRRLQIAGRNEGKIKSYDSCTDVRAWSHDIDTRNYYLRDWIKCDMPICVVPASTWSNILFIMTCRSRGRVISRCRSGCQSKYLVDRLSSSCTAMKDSLSNHAEFEKYFREENIESIHWPCDKCLEILKSIKMFWKIIVEKVLKINMPRANEFDLSHICSLRNIAKKWQKEMVEQATYIQSAILLSEQYNYCQTKETETICEFRNIAIQTDGKFVRQRISKCTSAYVKVVSLECESNDHEDNEVVMIYKNNVQELKHQFDLQKNEVDRLKKENMTLNIELQSFRQKNPKAHRHGDTWNNNDNAVALISNSLDSKESTGNKTKETDSEMIITLKNCKNENFRHVSIIQVTHKTNQLSSSEISGLYCKKEDPIHILNKVNETFGSMVKREISIASKANKSFENKHIVIKTSMKNVSDGKSVPSSSTSSSFKSESNCGSDNEIFYASIG